MLRFSTTSVTIAAIGAALVLLGVGLSAAHPSVPDAPSLHWAMARSSLEHVADADSVLARRTFDGPATLIQNDAPLVADPSPGGWRTTSTEKWESFAEFAAAARNGEVPSYVRAVH